MVDPGTAANYPVNTVASRPRRPVLRGPTIAIVPAVLDPLPDIAMHVVELCVPKTSSVFHLMRESLNVGRDGRIDILPLEPGRVDLQAQEPA